MINQTAYELGANRSCIRDLFEYGRARAAVVGEENVFDYSLGNPSIPSPPEVDETVRQILRDTPPCWCTAIPAPWVTPPPGGPLPTT